MNNKIKINKRIIELTAVDIFGDNNYVRIDDMTDSSKYKCKIYICGNNNIIVIKNPKKIGKLNISIGSERCPINNCKVEIGDNSNIGELRMHVESDNSSVTIGEDLLMSWGEVIRVGNQPHLIFDLESGEYIDGPYNFEIGNHCWVGEGCMLLSKTKIPDGCIVGAMSVVTKPFNEQNCIIAGNPASIKKRNIYWAKNVHNISCEKYKESFMRYKNEK